MKWRLLLAMAGLLAMVLVAQDVPLVGYIRDIERERLLAELERDAFILGGASEDLLSALRLGSEVEPDAERAVQSTIDAYAAQDGARIVVLDGDGQLWASSDPTDTRGEDFTNRPEIQQALTGEPASGERRSDTAQSNLVYVAVPVVSGAEIEGVVRITFRASVIDERTNEKTRGLALVFGISLLGASAAAVLLANNLVAPLRRLRRTTEHIAAGDFTERADELHGPKEIRSLASSFNAMTARIAGLLEQQRSFAGDASHQLRTPLTALRLQLERAAVMVDDDPDAARERIEAAGAETERLQRLVEGLLLIARSEARASETVRVDVTGLVEERAEVWEPFAAERGVRLVTRVEADLAAMALPNALEQVIDNFVDNALGVARDGDTITLLARRDAGGIAVHVVDEGPGMQPEHLARAFDRFWRAPDAPHGGSGIGLAVVDHLARLSGGRAELRNRVDRSGLDASIVLPAAP